MNILIIEDQSPEAYLLASLCEGNSRRVEMAATIPEAWERLSDEEFDIVFLDLTLPRSNAFETLDEVPAIKRKSRCVIVTGNQNPALLQRATELGADAYLMKHDPDFADKVLAQLSG